MSSVRCALHKEKLHRGQTMWTVCLDYIARLAGLGINPPSSPAHTTHIKAHRVIHKCVEALSYSFLFLVEYKTWVYSTSPDIPWRGHTTTTAVYGRSRAGYTLKGFASIRNVHGDQSLSIFFFFLLWSFSLEISFGTRRDKVKKRKKGNRHETIIRLGMVFFF